MLRPMDQVWVDRYGDPCRECGFVWTQDPRAAVADVEAIPVRFASAIGDRDGTQTIPELSWSAKAYVFHVADNLRNWAERLEGVRAGADARIANYDADDLAAARRYEAMSVQAGLRSLAWSARLWADATRASLDRGTVLDHPDRGVMSAADTALAPAHDATHHLWDVTRIIRSAG
jgi:uncharacterized damage-inducible protein DinB